MVTKTVGNSGCDYNCDGVNDEVQINYALAWANANAQSTVWVKGPFTYDLQDSLLIGSYTTLKLDSDVKFRLKNSAAWAVNKPIITQLVTPLANVEIYGGEIDGNYTNQTVALNSGYYPFILFSSVTNCNVHDMNMHDGAGHGVTITTGNTLIFHSNTVKDLGGDACLFTSSNTVDAYGNNISVRGNSGIHIKNTANSLIHNNYILGVDDVSGGIAGIIIEDTNGTTTYPVCYENVILDQYGCGILIQETGTGNVNKHKHCHCHHNTIRGAGTTTIYDFNSGCTVQGFNGAIIEYNNFDSCYNSGILQRYPPLSDGNTIQCNNNTITNTKHHKNDNYRSGHSGKGISNDHPTKASITLFNNICYNNVGGDYFGVNSSNDISTTPALQTYVPPTSYIQDEVSNYYIEGRTAYINRYPFRWQNKKIDMNKSIGQEKPPGMDGWCLEDFGFEGSNITLDCYAYSLDEMRNTIAAFYQPGKARLIKSSNSIAHLIK